MKEVYFLKCKAYVKIGISGNIRKRMASIQGANPFSVKLLYNFIAGEEEEAIKKEQYLHEIFSNNHYRGEWFEDTPYLRATIKHIRDNGWIGFLEWHKMNLKDIERGDGFTGVDITETLYDKAKDIIKKLDIFTNKNLRKLLNIDSPKEANTVNQLLFDLNRKGLIKRIKAGKYQYLGGLR